VIEVFADVTCPFAYVGIVRLLERRDAVGSDAVLYVRAWRLELVNGVPFTGPGVAPKVEELRREVAPDLFAGFDPERFPPTSLPALALAAAAYRSSPRTGERVSVALRRALFEQGRDIARVDVLDAVAREHGVEGPWDAGAVLVDWGDGRRRGGEGSPHYFLDGEGFFCPALHIDHPTGGLHVTLDPERFEELARRAFDPPARVPIGDLRL
jgi:2-hydroxychromene-2-carboxylate isomerase